MASTNNQARADLFDIELCKLIGDASAYAEHDPAWHTVQLKLLQARPHVRAMKSHEAATDRAAINKSLDTMKGLNRS